MSRLLSSLGCATLALLLAPDGLSGAAGRGKFVGPVLLPGGGVADPAGETGYFPNPAGGIDALDLVTGKLLWRTKEHEGERLLLATADRLFTRGPLPGKANQFQVIVHATGRMGATALTSRPVLLPEWVSVGVAHGRSFGATARLDKSALLVIWEARAWYAGGAAPPPQVERAARKSASGVVRVDLSSGGVKDLSGDEVPPALPRRPPADTQKGVLNGRVYTLRDEPIPGKDLQRRRFLQAADAAEKILWQHEIAAPVTLPPLP